MPDSTDPRKAIAYLKALLPAEKEEPAVILSEDDSPILRDLGNGLAISYVVDEGNRFAYIQGRHLKEQGIDRDQLHSTGIKNLQGIASTNLRVQPYQNTFAVLLDGNFEASLILIDQLWDSTFRQFVKGEYAVAVAARDILAFGDASSRAAIVELSGIISRIFPDGDHLLSDRILVRKGGVWKQRPL